MQAHADGFASLEAVADAVAVELAVADCDGPPLREAVAVTVDRLAELPHPGQMVKGALPDELDVPPAAL